jgi:hypothetical protein
MAKTSMGLTFYIAGGRFVLKRVLSVVILALMLGAIAVMPAMSAEKVVVYTTLDEPLAREVFAFFEKKTGIKVEWVRLATGECVARLEAEAANPQASIWYGGVGLGHIEAANKGLTIPYLSPNAKNIPPKMYLYVSMLSLPLGAMLSHNTFHIGHSTKTKISNKTTTRVVRSIGSRVSDFRSAMLSRARDVLGLGLFLTVSVAV